MKFLKRVGEGSALTTLYNIKREEEKMVLKVEGMMCENCVRHVTEAVREGGGTNVVVDMEAGTVTFDGGDRDAIVEAIEDAGYEVVE
ncbi:heavy-metal-associated domain-containing protein [Eubacteriales bacterium OttesenSCG-928-M02]|nr:heavy-metal-associated domain-containing protein [Eubacteriales bacterium OttesenSCG-928-M02]